MAILGHLRCFVADLILSRFMLFCVIFLGQKLRLRKFVDKYHVWILVKWINVFLPFRIDKTHRIFTIPSKKNSAMFLGNDGEFHLWPFCWHHIDSLRMIGRRDWPAKDCPVARWQDCLAVWQDCFAGWQDCRNFTSDHPPSINPPRPLQRTNRVLHPGPQHNLLLLLFCSRKHSLLMKPTVPVSWH